MTLSCSARSCHVLTLGLALLATAATVNAQTTMRAINPAIFQKIDTPPPPSDSSASTPDASGCAPNRKSSGVCFGSPQFGTYAASAAYCASYSGRLPTVGELIGYRAGPGYKETGIECSSDFDAGAGTLWCVGDHGQMSGVTLEDQAATLSKKPAMFRCVKYLKQN